MVIYMKIKIRVMLSDIHFDLEALQNGINKDIEFLEKEEIGFTRIVDIKYQSFADPLSEKKRGVEILYSAMIIYELELDG